MNHHPFSFRLAVAFRGALLAVVTAACASVVPSLAEAQIADPPKELQVSALAESDGATLLATVPEVCHDFRPWSGVAPAWDQRSHGLDDREKAASGPVANTAESTVDAGTGLREPTQIGACDEGVWKLDYKDASHCTNYTDWVEYDFLYDDNWHAGQGITAPTGGDPFGGLGEWVAVQTVPASGNHHTHFVERFTHQHVGHSIC